MTLATVPCPICGPQAEEILLWTKNDYRYVRCLRCRLVYINPQLDDESVAQIYSHLLYDEKSHRLDALRPTLRRYKSRLLHQFEAFRSSGHLLDVGCFKGFFLYSASLRGWRTMGTEVSEPAVRFAREELGQQVELCGLDRMTDLLDATFDVITLFDVIEHLSHPEIYLRRARQLLRPGGLLYIETPNFNALPRFVLGRRWTVFNSLHRYYFTPGSIAEILRAAGFQNIRIHAVGFLPLGTRREEPGRSKSRSKKGMVMAHLPVDLLRTIKDAAESLVFYPLNRLGLKVGTKIVVWAVKGA